LVASSVALRFFILFLGVMSCFYTIVCSPLPRCKSSLTVQWDIIDVSIFLWEMLMEGYITTESQYIRRVWIRQCCRLLWIAVLGRVLAVGLLYLWVTGHCRQYDWLVSLCGWNPGWRCSVQAGLGYPSCGSGEVHGRSVILFATIPIADDIR
jgi:hypothetical protein